VISVHVDDDGKLTADLGALPKASRERAALAVKQALRAVVPVDGSGDLPDAQWTAAWEGEIGRRVKAVKDGRAKRIPLERALRKIRAPRSSR
jgi:hypothetical protein